MVHITYSSPYSRRWLKVCEICSFLLNGLGQCQQVFAHHMYIRRRWKHIKIRINILNWRIVIEAFIKRGLRFVVHTKDWLRCYWKVCRKNQLFVFVDVIWLLKRRRCIYSRIIVIDDFARSVTATCILTCT